MSKKSNTREKILDLAEALLQERGFNAFSYQHISSVLRVKNAAVHYYFPSKTHLGLALIERVRARHQRLDENHTVDAAAAIEAYFALHDGYLRQGKKICPLSMLLAEYQGLPTEMQRAARIVEREQRAWIAQKLDAGRRDGQIMFSGESDDKAIYLSAVVNGATQSARVVGKKHFQNVVSQLRSELGLNAQVRESV